MVKTVKNHKQPQEKEPKDKSDYFIFSFSIYGWYLAPVIGLISFVTLGEGSLPYLVFYMFVLGFLSLKVHNDMSYTESFFMTSAISFILYILFILGV